MNTETHIVTVSQFLLPKRSLIASIFMCKVGEPEYREFDIRFLQESVGRSKKDKASGWLSMVEDRSFEVPSVFLYSCMGDKNAIWPVKNLCHLSTKVLFQNI